MTDLSARDRALVGLGAALGSNFIPCIEHHLPMARAAGLSDDQIRAALHLADNIRQVPARRALGRGTELLGTPASESAEAAGCCAPDDKPTGRGQDATVSAAAAGCAPGTAQKTGCC